MPTPPTTLTASICFGRGHVAGAPKDHVHAATFAGILKRFGGVNMAPLSNVRGNATGRFGGVGGASGRGGGTGLRAGGELALPIGER